MQRVGRDGLSQQQRAALRVCASCEWIYTGNEGCPKCGFASYGAHFVYGNNAYRYKYSQIPWKRKKMKVYGTKLDLEIKESVIIDKV